MSMKTSYRELDYAYGKAMQKLRNTIGLTQAGLSNRLGVAWRTVAGWEAGSSYPRAEHLKALIALAVQQQAFSFGQEQEEIHALWKLAHQKNLIDERWLSALLDPQRYLEEQAPLLQPRIESEPVEKIVTTAQITEQKPVDEESDKLSTPSDQTSLVCSLHLTDLDAVARQPQGQSDKPPPEAGTTGAPPPLQGGHVPQTPSPTNADQFRRKFFIALLIALVILIIIGSAGTLFFHAREGTTTQTNKRTYPGYLSGNGTLAFFDPLNQESGSQWSSYSSNNGFDLSCQFSRGAYHISRLKTDSFSGCFTNEMFSNFAFEVQLTIIQGDCGGITFRNDYNGHSYLFQVCQDSTYMVSKLMNYSGTDTKSSTSSAIKTGLGQQNKIAIVANGSTMIFYVNERQIDQEQDSSYASGFIALITAPFYPNGHPTEVAYSNARLWTL